VASWTIPEQNERELIGGAAPRLITGWLVFDALLALVAVGYVVHLTPKNI
jgi:hypothetical protein